LILNGKQGDMFNAILNYDQLQGDYPEIIICDIPRSSMAYVSWAAIEKIKDGVFYSGKYEGGQIVMNYPHVICFANAEPPNDAISADKWSITEIVLE
jgi:hypothetical protein